MTPAQRAEELLPEPLCPDCGTGVARGKCPWEVGPECPALRIAHKWRHDVKAVAAALAEAELQVINEAILWTLNQLRYDIEQFADVIDAEIAALVERGKDEK